MQRRDLNSPDAYLPVSASTQAIEISGATRTLYISGQVGLRTDGTISDDVAEPSRRLCQQFQPRNVLYDPRTEHIAPGSH